MAQSLHKRQGVLGLTSGYGVPANAIRLNGQPIFLNGQYIILTQAS